MTTPTIWRTAGASLGTIVWVLLYVALVLAPGARGRCGFALYVTAADAVWRSSDTAHNLYDDGWVRDRLDALGFAVRDIYRPNPPTLAVLMGALLVLPAASGALAWSALNFLALIVGIGALQATLRLPWRHGLWMVPLIALTQPVLHHFSRGQVYLLLFAVLSAVYWAIVRDRPGWAGVGIGLLLAAKTSGVWLVVVLLAMRQWRIVSSAVATVLIVTASSSLVVGTEMWSAYLDVLLDGPFLPFRSVTAYQTVASLWGQLFVLDPTWNPHPATNLPALANILTAVTILLAFIATARVGMPSSRNLERRALVTALSMALMVANSPVAEDYHYVLVIPSAVTAVWWAQRSRAPASAWLVLAVAACLLALPIPFKSPLLAEGWFAVLAFPRVYGSYVLWSWLLWALRSQILYYTYTCQARHVTLRTAYPLRTE
jgi:hypothetical protein